MSGRAALPVVVPPHPGESLPSWLDRLAADLDLPLRLLLDATGLTDHTHRVRIPAGYGLDLQPHQLTELAAVTDQPPNGIRRLLLAAYDGGPLDLTGLDLTRRDTIRQLAWTQWLYLIGSHACPACLRADNGAWQLTWRFPWSFACLRHQRLLLEVCPGCQRRCRARWQDNRVGPSFVSLVPQPAHCSNQIPHPIGTTPRRRPCGHDLRDVPTADVADSPILPIQRRLNAVLAASRASQQPPAEVAAWFRDLRALCALLLTLAQADDYGPLPPPLAEAVQSHLQQQQARRQERARLRQSGQDHRKGPRLRSWVTVPTSPALMAATCTVAVPILDARSPDALVSLVELTRRTSSNQLPSLLRQKQATERLLHLATVASQTNAPFFAIAGGLHAAKLRPPPSTRVQPQHIPQLLWAPAYHDTFAGAFTNIGVHPATARRFCSMALAKRVHPLTWGEAGELLGWPAQASENVANRLVHLLNRSGNTRAFHRALEALLAQLERRPPEQLIDYTSRRAALCHFRTITEPAWQAITIAQQPLPATDARRRNAAAWLWAELTSGDYRLAPAFPDGSTKNQRTVYRRFVAQTLPLIRPGLLRLSVDLGINNPNRH